MKKTFLGAALNLLVPVFLFGLFTPDPAAADERWRLIGKSRTDTEWYIDDETIFSPDEDIVAAWLKSVPDKAAPAPRVGEEVAETILKDIQRRNFGEYEYTEALWEINCSQDMFRVIYFVAYDRNGETATSSLTPGAAWAPLIPGSVGETLRDAVCGDPLPR